MHTLSFTSFTSATTVNSSFIGKRATEGKRTGVVVRVSQDGVYALLLLDTGPEDYWYTYAADLELVS